VTPAEALESPALINRVAGAAPASPTTVRAVLRGDPPGRVKAARSRVVVALAKEGVILPSQEIPLTLISIPK
jgi:hypothetical protein